MTHEIDLENCRECKESKCIMSKYYGMEVKAIEKYDAEIKYQKRVKAEYNKKIRDYYLKETKFYTEMKDREAKLIKYDRKPYMNDSDWTHDCIWFICIQKLMELQERYYNSIKY